MKNILKNKKASVVILAFLLLSLLSGCTAVSTESTKETTQAAIKAVIANISPEEAKKRLDSEEAIIVLDVRTKEEYDGGHIKDSVLIPVDKLKDEAESKLKDKETVIFVYCRSGNRSTTAANILVELGYKNVYNLGGINQWPYEILK
jgi:rhodanese-related sulfurtransferase